MIYNNNYYIKPLRKNIKINLIRMLSNKIFREVFLKKQKEEEEEINLQKQINGNFYIVDKNESIYIDKDIEDNIEKSYVLLKNDNNDHKINLNLKKFNS